MRTQITRKLGLEQLEKRNYAEIVIYYDADEFLGVESFHIDDEILDSENVNDSQIHWLYNLLVKIFGSNVGSKLSFPVVFRSIQALEKRAIMTRKIHCCMNPGHICWVTTKFPKTAVCVLPNTGYFQGIYHNVILPILKEHGLTADTHWYSYQKGWKDRLSKIVESVSQSDLSLIDLSGHASDSIIAALSPLNIERSNLIMVGRNESDQEDVYQYKNEKEFCAHIKREIEERGFSSVRRLKYEIKH